jgi:flagellar motor switch protein FliM
VGLLTVCVPLVALEGFLQEKKSGRLMTGTRSRLEDRAAARRNLEHAVRQVGLPVSARLRAFGVSAGSLARLVQGQVILTPHHADAEVELLVNGSPRFSGRIGQHHGHFGVRIAQHCEEQTSRNPKGRVIP